MLLSNIEDYLEALETYLDMIIDGIYSGKYPSANIDIMAYIESDENFLADKINILFASGLVNLKTYKQMCELATGKISREDAEDLMNTIEILATSSNKIKR